MSRLPLPQDMKSTVLRRYVRWSVWALGGTLFVAAVCLLLRPPLVNPLSLEYWPEHLVGARRFFAYTFVWRGTSEERLVKRFGRPTETMLTGTHQWHDYTRKQAALGYEPVPSDWKGRVLVYEVQGDIHAIAAYYLLKPDGRLKAATVSDQLL